MKRIIYTDQSDVCTNNVKRQATIAGFYAQKGNSQHLLLKTTAGFLCEDKDFETIKLYPCVSLLTLHPKTKWKGYDEKHSAYGFFSGRISKFLTRGVQSPNNNGSLRMRFFLLILIMILVEQNKEEKM